MKKISIIIVNYNTGEELILCIKSIRKYLINIPYEILLVDNNSTDNSRELLKENFKDIQKFQHQYGRFSKFMKTDQESKQKN